MEGIICLPPRDAKTLLEVYQLSKNQLLGEVSANAVPVF